MKYFQIILITGFSAVVFVSCNYSCHSELLPKDYELVEMNSFIGYVDRISIYQINADGFYELSEFPNFCSSCKGSKSYVKWTNFINLQENETSELFIFIESENRTGELQNLLNKLKKKDTNILFSGCSIEKIGAEQKKYNYYYQYSFLDSQSNKLYILDKIRDPF